MQNARNLGGGSLLCALSGAGGEAVFALEGGATVERSTGGENRGAVCYGAAVVLPGGRVTRKGGRLHYDSV